MALLVDIFLYNVKTEKWEDYGYSVCPMLQVLNIDADKETIEYFVNSGYFLLPVYKGRITP